MNTETLRAITNLIDALQGAEQAEQFYLAGTVDVVDASDEVVATVSLNGTVEHELTNIHA